MGINGLFGWMKSKHLGGRCTNHTCTIHKGGWRSTKGELLNWGI
jgi:hypothetical protein